MEKPTPSYQSALRLLVPWLLIIVGLYLTRLYSYNLFHSLAEVFAVLVAWGIFMVAWNTRRYNQARYLLFLGIAYLWVGGLDLLHALAYQGMGVFPHPGPELATQLWIAARYVEASSLLAASLLTLRSWRPRLVLVLYAGLFAAILAAIFTDNFPVCFRPASGLTPFKVYSEYLVCLLLAGAGVMFWRRRQGMDQGVLRLVLWSIGLTIASELCFTLYTSVHGLANQTGHVLKVISFYLLYRAAITASLTRPYEVLFRELKARQENLAESEARVRAILASTASPIILLSPDLKVHQINQEGEQLFGWGRASLLNRDFLRAMAPREQHQAVRQALERALGGQVVRDQENQMRAQGGKLLTFHWNCARLEDSEGQPLGVIISGQDISERKQAEQERERLIKDLQSALAEIKTLSGMLPICANCKKVRDDSGYWRQIEAYVEQHSSAEFSHGLCPDCARQLYPSMYQDSPPATPAGKKTW